MNKLFVLTTGFASVQWMFFIFANTVVVPVSIGAAFGLAPDETAMVLRSSLIFTGIASALQGLFGHRYPLMEGHSGLMWGLLLTLSTSAAALGMDYSVIGGGIATGVIAAGVVMVVMGLLKRVTWLNHVFTPMVTNVYLFLLAVQLIIIFFTGMLKVNDDGAIDPAVSFYSVCIVIAVAIMKIKGKEWISNFSILIGITVGWAIYVLLFPGETAAASQASSFYLFPLGMPNLQWGIVIASFVTGLINMSNTVVSVQAASKLYKEKAEEKKYNRSFFLTGVFTIASAPLGLVPYAPYTSSLGFLESTRIFERLPFIIGGFLISLLGIIPAAGTFLSGIPVTVGNAVLFVAYLQLFGSALKSVQAVSFNSNTIFRIAVPILVGISIMAIDPVVFRSLPLTLQPLLTNGMVTGVILSIILEKFVRWDKYE
ncbi:uracil/xanthine transporter [Domibacillus epiphyticus]|uniref:Uracil/xanthine transporter n=1 Tax=Domibacillus epiphyticus TaxID=1714355 RepID=A0A1V2ABH2_9BACI|nr:uracil/xanthine transporter [Domibacillus epiphyticus]OMP68144.1 uracil/xanthine transporter [Domibacillus epiphyticus]